MSDEKAKKEQSLADQILAADDLPKEEIVIPEWGGKKKFLVIGLNGKERYNLVSQCADEDGDIDNQKMSALSIAKCLCDGDGQRIFSDGQAEQIMQKNGRVIERLLTVVNRINGFGRYQMEQAEKNS